MASSAAPLGALASNRWRVPLWGAAALLLLLPLVAMQFTDEVDWTAFDFVVMGALLLAACGACEVGMRLSGNRAYRAGVAVAVAAAFLLVWINLAVGIIGNERDRANLLFGGVLVVGIGGALIARFRPAGMARALFATAVAQMIVLAAAVAMGIRFDSALVGLTACFAALWFFSAWLFGRSAQQSASVRDP